MGTLSDKYLEFSEEEMNITLQLRNTTYEKSPLLREERVESKYASSAFFSEKEMDGWMDDITLHILDGLGLLLWRRVNYWFFATYLVVLWYHHSVSIFSNKSFFLRPRDFFVFHIICCRCCALVFILFDCFSFRGLLSVHFLMFGVTGGLMIFVDGWWVRETMLAAAWDFCSTVVSSFLSVWFSDATAAFRFFSALKRVGIVAGITY